VKYHRKAATFEGRPAVGMIHFASSNFEAQTALQYVLA
jgi:hypothetical protein